MSAYSDAAAPADDLLSLRRRFARSLTNVDFPAPFGPQTRTDEASVGSGLGSIDSNSFHSGGETIGVRYFLDDVAALESSYLFHQTGSCYS